MSRSFRDVSTFLSMTVCVVVIVVHLLFFFWMKTREDGKKALFIKIVFFFAFVVVRFFLYFLFFDKTIRACVMDIWGVHNISTRPGTRVFGSLLSVLTHSFQCSQFCMGAFECTFHGWRQFSFHHSEVPFSTQTKKIWIRQEYIHTYVYVHVHTYIYAHLCKL